MVLQMLYGVVLVLPFKLLTVNTKPMICILLGSIRHPLDFF